LLAAEKVFKLSRPFVREDLHAFFVRRRLEKSPGYRFYGIKSNAHKKQNFSFPLKIKRSGSRPVGEGDWKIPQGVSKRKLKISSTAGRWKAKFFSS
jgi:hypothetical protein